MAIIYKITNLINGKIYIGETTQPLSRRWQQHCADCQKENSHESALHGAMKKYGIENFSVEQIDTVADEERFQKETEYILYYNSLTCQHGYNIVLFGSGRGLYNVDEVIELWKNGYTEKEISELMQCGDKAVRNFLYANGITKAEIRTRAAKKYNARKISIQQYDESGNFIKEWESISACVRDNPNFSQSGISAACSKNRCSYKHYLWKYTEDDTPIEFLVKCNAQKNSKHCYPKKISQIDVITKKVIATYDSAAKAQAAIHAKDKSHICRAARQGTKAYGYYWRYIDE